MHKYWFIAANDVPKSCKRWKIMFTWLKLNAHRKAVCTLCTEAVSLQLSFPSDSHAVRTIDAFVKKRI